MGTTDSIRASFNDRLAELRRLKDEVRVKVHLAGMELREQWDKLEPRVNELERSVEAGGEKAKEVVSEQLSTLGDALRQIRDTIKEDVKKGL